MKYSSDYTIDIPLVAYMTMNENAHRFKDSIAQAALCALVCQQLETVS